MSVSLYGTSERGNSPESKGRATGLVSGSDQALAIATLSLDTVRLFFLGLALEKLEILPHTLGLVYQVQAQTEYRALQQAQTRLGQHAVFASLGNPGALQVFMEHHVWAVWDFMSLVKRLQRDLTCTTLPWLPSPHPRLARFINEIVLVEESDEIEGRVFSHFELYLRAMDAVGADCGPITAFCEAVRNGEDLSESLATYAPEAAARFVRTTLELVASPHLEEVASAFLYGRESLIPIMFENALLRVSAEKETKWIRLYLERHIEVDGDEHSILAERLLQECTKGEPMAVKRAVEAARVALEARHALWDQTHRCYLSQNEAAE